MSNLPYDSPTPETPYPDLRHPHGYFDLKYSVAEKVIHSLSVDIDRRVEVIGEPGNGSYEWGIRDTSTGKLTEYSNVGYGQSTVALRDGLLAFHGPSTLPAD